MGQLLGGSRSADQPSSFALATSLSRVFLHMCFFIHADGGWGMIIATKRGQAGNYSARAIQQIGSRLSNTLISIRWGGMDKCPQHGVGTQYSRHLPGREALKEEAELPVVRDCKGGERALLTEPPDVPSEWNRQRPKWTHLRLRGAKGLGVDDGMVDDWRQEIGDGKGHDQIMCG